MSFKMRIVAPEINSNITADKVQETVGHTEDLRVPVQQVKTLGAFTPDWAVYKNNGGTVSTGKALNCAGSIDMVIPSDVSLNFNGSSFTIMMWIKTNIISGSDYLVNKNSGNWRIFIRNNQVRFSINGQTFRSSADIIYNSRQMIGIVVTNGATSTVDIYIDNTLSSSDSFTGTIIDSTAAISVGSRNGSNYFNGIIDELRIWNTDQSGYMEVYYNNNLGTEEVEGTEIVGYHLNEGTGTNADNFEGTAVLDATLSTSSWIDGLVNSGTATVGVIALYFSPIYNSSVWFSVQMPHGWNEETTIYPHVHWIAPTSGSGNVKWNLEYHWSNIHSDFTNTSVVTNTYNISSDEKDRHQMTNIPSTGISGTGMTYSSILNCRLERDVSVSDNYTDSVVLLEFDIHYSHFRFGKTFS